MNAHSENIDFDLTRSFARKYLNRNWTPIGFEHKSKAPRDKGWQKKKHDSINVDKEFAGTRSNIGLLLGEPSGALVDVDLDCPEALKLANALLPPTNAEFGRPSTPRAHRLYIADVPATIQFVASSGMVVELRSTGGQTMCPPSVHPSGERVAWEGELGDPAAVDPGDLKWQCSRLAFASLLLRAWKDGMRNKLGLATVGALLDHGWQEEPIETLLTIISKVAGDQPKDVVPPAKLLDQAGKRREAQKKRTGLPTLARLLGEKPELLREWIDRRPESEQGIFPSSDPILLAREFAKTLDLVWHWRGDFYQWAGHWWILMDDEELKGRLYPWLETVRVKERNNVVPVRGTRALVNDILSALAGVRQLPNSIEQPFWLESRAGDPNPADLMPFRNGVLDLATMELSPPDPRLFALHGVECDYDPSARAPAWGRFTRDLFPDDPKSITTLNEILGYSLSSDTSLQKGFALIGDKRSGKSTVGRVLRAAVGVSRYINPRLSDFGETFGPANMIGKSVAMVSDSRTAGKSKSAVVETILTVTGEDAQSIRRMFKSHWNGILPTRLIFTSNGPLNLKDPTGVVVSRFIVVYFAESFYGREDHKLTDKLLAELPGIINIWLDALSDLRERGHFVQPESALHVLDMMDEGAGTVRRFVEEECTVGPEWEINKSYLYVRFKEWSKDHGHYPMADSTFGQDLFGLHVGIREKRKRRKDDPKLFDRMYAGITLSDMVHNGGNLTPEVAALLCQDALLADDEDVQKLAPF